VFRTYILDQYEKISTARFFPPPTVVFRLINCASHRKTNLRRVADVSALPGRFLPNELAAPDEPSSARPFFSAFSA
jgi:hypothetical protein